MFGKRNRASAKAEKEKALLQGRIDGLVQEKHFWVEQSRAMQNQIQTWQRLYAELLQQAARGPIADDELRSHVSDVCEQLRKPVTGVEAVMALTSSLLTGTQGAYTPVEGGRGLFGIEFDPDNRG